MAINDHYASEFIVDWDDPDTGDERQRTFQDLRRARDFARKKSRTAFPPEARLIRRISVNGGEFDSHIQPYHETYQEGRVIKDEDRNSL